MIKQSKRDNIGRQVSDAVAKKQISKAFELLEGMAGAAGASWVINSKIQELRRSFGYLRTYALNGVTDPSRQSMLTEISNGILKVASVMERDSLIEDSTSLYFGVLRYERLQQESSIEDACRSFKSLNDRLSLAMLSGKQSVNEDFRKLRNEHAASAKRLFNLVWTTFPLTGDDIAVMESFLLDDNIRTEFREQLLGAVLLGNLSYPDEKRLVLLAKAYLSGIRRIELKALVLLVIAMWMQRDSPVGTEFENILMSMKERSGWHEDLKMIFLNLVRTRDTDRISRTMTEELLPEMMKLRPRIFKKLSETDSVDDFAPSDVNPEWESLLEESGVAKKLKELNELQSEGGDVLLSTFSGLKSFAFFHDVSNWLLPFFTDQSDTADILDDSAADLGEMIEMAPMLCDSDKYSIVFAMGQMPRQNRRMMLDQFRMQNINVAEIRNSMLNPENASRSEMANRFIQDLYRFFTLFRRKNEFRNPFAAPINLAALPQFASDLIDASALEAVGEFYFKRGYFTEASEIFKLLISAQSVSAALIQKEAYCQHRLGNIAKALELYEKSELLSPGNEWTMRRIAQSLKQLGRHAEAIAYYERLIEKKPEDIGLTLSLGHCCLAVEDYAKAMACYHKVDYLDVSGRRALRPLAWCAFVESDFTKSRKYYEKVLEDNPSATDYLNAGHLYMVLGDYRQAADLYARFLKLSDNNFDELEKAMASDLKYLEKHHVDPNMISLVMDAVQYP